MTILPSFPGSGTGTGTGTGGRRPVRARHLARSLAVALVAGLAGLVGPAGCYESNTVVCTEGVVCPEGSTCTADGKGCTTNLCGNGVMDPGEATFLFKVAWYLSHRC